MAQQPLERVVRNIDRRLARVEKILPTLATKAELAEAIAPLATKAELAEAIAPLATKAELAEVRAEVREEGGRTRRHFDVVAERLEGKIELVAEGLVALRDHVNGRFERVTTDVTHLDRRVTKLEARRRR
jgi:hypothetical protein